MNTAVTFPIILVDGQSGVPLLTIRKNGLKELENGLMMDGVFQKESSRFLKF